MEIYLIEGASGTGKTTVCQELQKRGYRAVEADEDIAHYADPKTGLPTDEHIQDNWIWNKEKFTKATEQGSGAPVFICGGAMNQNEFEHHFTKIFTLHVDDETLKHRLLTRTNNPFGKHPDELARQLEWNNKIAQHATQSGTVLIDTARSVNEVVDAILNNL